MALDVQQNWNVSMANNLEQTMKQRQVDPEECTAMRQEDVLEGPPIVEIFNTQNTQENTSNDNARESLHLPDEILLQILAFVPTRSPTTQSTYASCALVSKQWYFCATPFLYACPSLYGSNYARFVSTICPSINLHVRKSRLADLVKVLDLRALVHQGSKSVTARLLGRVKGNLERFRAPQASFALNCLPALGKCVELQDLDLSLVSESPPLPELFKTLAGLQKLEVLRLPRSSGFGSSSGLLHGDEASSFLRWPPRLTALSISGGIDQHFVQGITAFPHTLTDLTIEHCPSATTHHFRHLLRFALRPVLALKRLKVAHMPRLSSRALDCVFELLPQLEEFSVGADYVTNAIFDIAPGSQHIHETLQQNFSHDLTISDRDDEQRYTVAGLNIRIFEITGATGSNVMEDAEKILPMDFIIALDDGHLPKLKQIRVAKSLGWTESCGYDEDTGYLADLLGERADEVDRHAGVWVING